MGRTRNSVLALECYVGRPRNCFESAVKSMTDSFPHKTGSLFKMAIVLNAIPFLFCGEDVALNLHVFSN